MTLRPLWSARDTSLPSASGRVKAGATSPGWSRSLIGLVSSYVLVRSCAPVEGRGPSLTGGADGAVVGGTDRLSGVVHQCGSGLRRAYGGGHLGQQQNSGADRGGHQASSRDAGRDARRDRGAG